ncbi:shikimate dehydrogenase [Halobacillus litoralis]|uniref:shikimate dehydrogenase n=1 Tax=Halobacillus litoralis TaxID=45668 RepID=UPI001370B019|nr:shikimate dehydrogenase [Halobacillus litoralis]MYL37244.1 shikimate dehydrogenase [Halobacillus litoralis]
MYTFGLAGFPVGHSLSPWIHGQLMKQTGVEGDYQLFEIKPEDFDEQISEMKNRDLDGFNVTVPYKEKIIPHLDGVDGSAAQLGAVNTVKRTSEGWIGYNTDGTGFLHSLQARFPDLFEQEINVLLLGSGGAARGIFDALMKQAEVQVDVANRTLSRAESMIAETGGAGIARAVSFDEAEQAAGEYDLIIQTTTVGMSPNEDTSILSLQNLKEGTVVSDIVYRPVMTTFLKEAEQKGARLHFGHEMLLQQAVYAFQIWTDLEPEARPLLEKFERKLKGE